MSHGNGGTRDRRSADRRQMLRRVRFIEIPEDWVAEDRRIRLQDRRAGNRRRDA